MNNLEGSRSKLRPVGGIKDNFEKGEARREQEGNSRAHGPNEQAKSKNHVRVSTLEGMPKRHAGSAAITPGDWQHGELKPLPFERGNQLGPIESSPSKTACKQGKENGKYYETVTGRNDKTGATIRKEQKKRTELQCRGQTKKSRGKQGGS